MYHILILFINLLYQEIAGDSTLPTLQCRAKIMNSITKACYCYFEEVFELNETHPFFNAISNPADVLVTDVRFFVKGNAKMHTFTNNICLAFPNATVISAQDLEMEVIHGNAFENCQQLQHVCFNHNKLSTIAPETFIQNKKLMGVSFNDNKFTEFDFKVFENLTEILIISLYGNNIKKLNFIQMQKLTVLELSNNGLEDLDAEMIKSYFPSLNHF